MARWNGPHAGRFPVVVLLQHHGNVRSPSLRFPGLSSPPRVWALALWPPAHTYLSSASPASAFSSDLGRTHSGCGLALGTEEVTRDDQPAEWAQGLSAPTGPSVWTHHGPTAIRRGFGCARGNAGAQRVDCVMGWPGVHEDGRRWLVGGRGRGCGPFPGGAYLSLSLPQGPHALAPWTLQPMCCDSGRWAPCLSCHLSTPIHS